MEYSYEEITFKPFFGKTYISPFFVFRSPDHLDFPKWQERRENMQPSTQMGTPTPNKTAQPPGGEVGEGEMRGE